MAQVLAGNNVPARAAFLPALAGLLVAWGGTALLVSPAAQSWVEPSSAVAAFLGQVALWIVCAAVIGIVVFWERKPLRSLWLRPLQWESFAWAGVLTIATIVLIMPVTEWLRTAAGLSGYAKGMEMALAYPVWLRVFAAITAGVVEETMFRGYAVTRLAQLTGSLPLAIMWSSVVFGALHLPVWGAGPSFAFFVGGLATTTFFVWRRDLLAMIVSHAVIDVWGLVVTPQFSRWWE